MQGTPETLLQRWQSVQAKRLNYDNTWQRVTEIIWPFGGDFTHIQAPGDRRTDEIFETTAAFALDRFAAFLESLLTPRNQTWHRLRASVPELNEQHRVKTWMDLVNDRLFLWRNDPASRYYSQKHEGYKALGAWGNDTLFIDRRPMGGVRYRYCHLGDTWIETDHENAVNRVYYRRRLTHAQAVGRWGLRAPEVARKSVELQPLEEAEYLHVVYPREGYDPERTDFLGMGWESVILETSQKQLVEEGGYHELPYKHSRYTVNPGEDWGRGPAELVLPDVETLQEQEKTFQRAGHKVADPPLLLQSDGPLGKGQRRVKLRPGGLTYGGVDVNGRPTILPLQTGANLPLTETMMDQKREAISAAFLNDLFLMLTRDKEMTATEVLEIAKEKGQLLTPTTGRQESEMLGPQIEREIGEMIRQGVVPEMPPELQEAQGEYDIVYDNEASRLQRSEEGLAITRTLDAIGHYSQFDPTLTELPDWHLAMRELRQVTGAPAKLFKDERAVEQAIAAQAERSSQMEAVDQAQQGAAALKDMSAAGVPVADMAQQAVA